MKTSEIKFEEDVSFVTTMSREGSRCLLNPYVYTRTCVILLDSVSEGHREKWAPSFSKAVDVAESHN